ncbi:MAG: 5-formyltetrahydrofolate cyclo-ligase [Flavobacteriales bacterium]
MTKKEARKKYKDIRNLISEDLLGMASHSICKQLMELDLIGKTVHVFLPIKKLKEVNLWEFIHHCHAEKVTVCTSVSDFENHSMSTVLLTPETALVENDWGIPEPTSGKEISPKEIDLVIVPLLYADANGNRVGYGKGFYDRFLAGCRTDVQKFGVNFFAPKEAIEDAEETDVKLDGLVVAR